MNITEQYITVLENKILDNTNKYYNGESCVPDEIFDHWIEKLRELDPDNPILHSVGWGYNVSTSSLKEYKHLNYLSGIGNKPRVQLDTELPSGRIKTPKMDGGSVELQYHSGKLIRALTRGDGNLGLDCTTKLIHAQGVVIDLPTKFTGNIVGEFVISDEDLENFSDSISQRNVPNGFLSRNNPSTEDCRRFSFIAYKIGQSTTHQFNSRVSILEFIKSQGFLTVSYILGSVKYADAVERLRFIGGKHYLLDGIVSDSSEIIQYESGVINYVDEVAYKTVTQTANVTVRKIDWNLTRTGKLIPTVVFDDVELSGAHINRALGHNARYILDTGIDVGAQIEVIRSGEVIPYIYEVTNSVVADLPHICPKCKKLLEWSGVNLVCTNPDCEGQNYSNLYQWFSNLANVDNLGNKLIHMIIQEYDISQISEFYTKVTDFSRLSQVPGIGQSKIATVKEAFDKLNSSHSIENYLVALNIKGLSWESAKKIVHGTHIRDELSADYFSDKFEKELADLRGVSYSTKYNLLVSWGKLVDLIPLIKIDSDVADTSSQLSDIHLDNPSRLRICITGKLSSGTKAEFYARYNSQIIESDIKSCDYLVCNEDKGSSKLRTAHKLNKPVITEQHLVELLNKEN